MSTYLPTIGLEIHAELKTTTKMFCNCKNDPDEAKPNVNICPVCTAQPGTLPVINKKAVMNVLKVGVAVGGDLADYTEFDRKNYFYPDIPKAYQLSQYKYPLVSGGSIREIELTRIHLEEDTARSTHDAGDYSLVDFNRAGVPLMELVTEPVIHTAEDASAFARELRLILRHLGVSDANMEKGEMRVEANVSVAKEGDPLGTKVEVKNLNSFKIVEKAIAYEVKRQSELLEKGGEVAQETRGWDEDKEKTFSQRAKESSHDYRYFPDPDLPKLKLSELPEFSKDTLQAEMPLLPEMLRKTYSERFKISDDAVEILVNEIEVGNFFSAVATLLEGTEKGVKLAANYITSDIIGLAKEGVFKIETIETLNPKEFVEIITMITAGDLSSRGAKDVLRLWLQKGGDPKKLAEDNNLIQKSNAEELIPMIESIIEEHKNVVEEYKAGKEASLKFLVGQGMKLSKGSANPQLLEKLLKEHIG